nr:hypothetical protein [uncultured bacterium]
MTNVRAMGPVFICMNLNRNHMSLFSTEKGGILLIIIGSVLRLKHYFENRSLWLDEAYVALEILIKTFKEMVTLETAFPRQPGTPLLFQLITKINISVFGNNEFIMRLWPLLSSLIGLLLFTVLLKKCVGRTQGLLALSFFVFCEPLIYYASELKPYISDVMITLILYLFYEKVREKNFDLWAMRYFGLISALCLWISFPSMFITCGLLMAIMVSALKAKDIQAINGVLIAFLMWSVSFTFLYFTILRFMVQSEYILDSWSGSFLSASSNVWEGLHWGLSRFLAMFEHPLGLHYTKLAALFFVIGCVAVFRRNRRQFGALMCPILLVVFAACFKKYPFKGRMLLFMTPLIYIFFCEGISVVCEQFKRYRSLAYILIVGLLIFHPVKQAFAHLVYFRESTESRIVMQYLKDQIRPSDIIFFNNSAQYALLYYLNSQNFNIENLMKKESDYVKGEWHRIEFGKIDDLITFHGDQKEIWFVFLRMLFRKGKFYGFVSRVNGLRGGIHPGR